MIGWQLQIFNLKRRKDAVFQTQQETKVLYRVKISLRKPFPAVTGSPREECRPLATEKIPPSTE